MAIIDGSERVTVSVHDLTEGQRIEYQRRVDCCGAVMSSLGPLIIERKKHDDVVKDEKALASARWPWVVGGIGLVIYWLAEALELPGKGLGIAIVLLMVGTFVRSAMHDWAARSQLRQIETAIVQLRFHWLEAGGRGNAFNEYCDLLRDSDGYPDIKAHANAERQVFAPILEHVGRIG